MRLGSPGHVLVMNPDPSVMKIIINKDFEFFSVLFNLKCSIFYIQLWQ